MQVGITAYANFMLRLRLLRPSLAAGLKWVDPSDIAEVKGAHD